jgi:CheY-like chemotaxis protein
VLKTLIVEDSKFQQESMKNLLSDLDLSIVSANNGKEALDYLSIEDVDFLIIDLLMPVMNGIELIKNLKTQNFDKPFIIVTSDIQETTRNHCLEYGAHAILEKPLKKDELKKVLTSVFKEAC